MTQTGVARPVSRPLLLAAVAVGGVLAPLNSTMLAVALPVLRSEFAVGHGAAGWLVSSYLIAMAVAQPLGGRLGDQLGRALVFRWGLVAFLGLSLAAALSPSFLALVTLRTGQALVGAAVIPNGLAMLRESLPPDRLGRSMGLMGAAASIAAAVGPLIGTVLLAAGSWRLLFLMNVPLVIVGLAFVRALRYPERGPRTRVALDWLGALAFGAILAGLTLILGSVRGEGDRTVLIVVAVSLIPIVALFVRGQRTSPVPVVEWRLFRRRSFAGSTSYVMLSNLVMYTTLVSIPFFVVEVQGRGSGTAGPLLGAMSILVALVSPAGGRLSDRVGRRAPALAGSLIAVVASGMLVVGVAPEVPVAFLAAALALLGLGIGMGFGPATAAAAESVSPAQAGSAAGANSMMRYVGGIIGVAILGGVMADTGPTPDVALFRGVFIVMVGVSLLAVVSAFFIRRRLPYEAVAERSVEPVVPAASSLRTAGGHR